MEKTLLYEFMIQRGGIVLPLHSIVVASKERK